MIFRLVPKSVTLNDLERRNSQPPRNFTEFGSFLDGHDMEVFMYVAYLDHASQCSLLYFVVRIWRRRKKFTFAISSADEFLVNIQQQHVISGVKTLRTQDTLPSSSA